jgi:general secretion pathway protein M
VKQWWAGLKTREQRVVLAGAGLVLILMLYLFAWQPLVTERARLQASVEKLRDDAAWMQQAANQVKALRGSGAVTRQPVTSLLGVINSTARPVLKGAELKRVEEDRSAGVRVWIESVAFDDLAIWLGDLKRRYNIDATSVSAERIAKPGRVNVRLILQVGS